jgi:RimJ/RimL family protein N-acetyltransferase
MRVPPTTGRLRDGRFIELRSPDPEDAAATLSFVRKLSCESFQNLNHPPSFFESMTVEAQAQFLDSLARHPKNFMLCAWASEHVVGSTNLAVQSASFSSHAAELGLGVLESHRGVGLGRLLTATLIATAEANDISNLILRVRTFNQSAIRLYESAGFERVGTLRAIARLPEKDADEYIYQRISATRG